MNSLKEAIAREDGESGFSVIAQVKNVYDKQTRQGNYGEYTTQNIIVQDVEDNSVTCQIGLTKSFVDEGAKGSIFTFKSCKKRSYKNKAGAIVPNIDCKELALGVGEAKAEATDKPKPLPSALLPSAPKVDWDKKDLMIARESALKSAATIISAQIQASLVDKDINMLEYAVRMSDFFVSFIYDGKVKKPQEGTEAENAKAHDLEKRLAIIKTIQAAQTRYGLNIEAVMEVVNNKFGRENKVELLQELDCEQLNEILIELINTKALKKETKQEPAPEAEQTDDSLF